MNNCTTKKLCFTAIFMGLNIAFSAFGIPVPGGHFYLTDAVICTAAIILDPLYAFFVGGIGSFFGDLIYYPPAMFVSLIVHGVQAVIISAFSNYFFKSRQKLSSGIGVSLGAIVMVVGYTLGKIFVYSTREYAIIKLPYEILQATVGAVSGMLLCYKCKIIDIARKHGIKGPVQNAQTTQSK